MSLYWIGLVRIDRAEKGEREEREEERGKKERKRWKGRERGRERSRRPSGILLSVGTLGGREGERVGDLTSSLEALRGLRMGGDAIASSSMAAKAAWRERRAVEGCRGRRIRNRGSPLFLFLFLIFNGTHFFKKN